MAYGNKMKKSPKKPARNKKSTAKVGQRKAYRMTGKAPGN